MKTNQIMTRRMGQLQIQQRTKDGMYNATELLKQWNKYNGAKKELNDYFFNESTKDLIEAMNKDGEFLHRGNSPYVKSKARSDRGGGTWMHPLLFIDFAMWLNPKFRLEVLKFAKDNLIELRHRVGDEYRRMTDAINSIKGDQEIGDLIKKVNSGINFIVFNHDGIGLRNKATAEQLQRIAETEQLIYNSIELSMITTHDQLITLLRAKYANEKKKTSNTLTA